MSASARTSSAPRTGGTSDAGPATPGTALTRAGLAVGLWVVLVVLAGGVLGWVGWWTPWVAWPVAVLAAAGAWRAVRSAPGVPLTRGAGRRAMVLLTLGFAVYAGATHAEQVMPRRDAASNLQAAISLSRDHERVVPVDVDLVGGPELLERGDVTLASAAFYQVGSDADPAIQPQFLMAPAVVYGYGVWAGGPGFAQLLPAVLMAVALLLIGLLAALVTRPWWGVAALGLTGVLFPVLNVARATYSEQLAMVTLVGGLLAITLSVSREGLAARRLALLGGVLVGGTGLARIDFLREVMLLLPFIAIGAALGRRWVRPLALGLGGVDGRRDAARVGTVLPLPRGHPRQPRAAPRPRGRRRRRVRGRVVAVASGSGGCRACCWPADPDVAAGLVVLAGLLLWSRPWWMTVRQDPNDPGARYVAGMQRRQGLPVDGGRTYAEHTVDWLSWYVGWAALVVALVVLALALRRALLTLRGGRLEAWAPAFVVAAGTTLLVLLRPGITRCHPWGGQGWDPVPAPSNPSTAEPVHEGTVA